MIWINYRVVKYIGIGLSAFFLNGCGLLYTNIRVPYSYNAATPADVHADKEDPTAIGQSCTRSVLYLVAWGDAGYATAVRKALESYPKSTFYDVKMDVKVSSYLIGLYTKSCTI